MLMMIAKIGKVFWTSRNCRKLAEHLLMNFLHEILMINGMVMMARRIYMSMVLRRMRIEWVMVRQSLIKLTFFMQKNNRTKMRIRMIIVFVRMRMEWMMKMTINNKK